MSEWIEVCKESDVLENAGSCVLVENEQIAIFNLEHRKRWFAVQNRCPHENQFVLSRGLTGYEGDVPKVACPLHKNTFCLLSGKHLGGNEEWTLRTYPIKIEDGNVFLKFKKGDA